MLCLYANSCIFTYELFFPPIPNTHFPHPTPNSLSAHHNRMQASDLTLTRETLVHKLMNLGETMTKEELESCINTLMGKASDRSKSVKLLGVLLKGSFTPDEFATEVLGFSDD